MIIKRTKRIIFFSLGVFLLFFISGMTPPEGLTQASMKTMGVILCTIMFWVGSVFPFIVGCLFMYCALILSGAAPYSVVSTGIAGSVVCFMFGAMGICAALNKTGAMKRIAFSIMRLFPPTFTGMSMGIFLTFTMINFLIPSTAAKVTIYLPLAKTISDAMGFGPNTRGRYGIWMAAFAGMYVTSPGFYTGNLICPFMMSFQPADVVAAVTNLKWALYAFPWMVLVTLGMIIGIRFLYKPEVNTTELSRDFIRTQLEQMGGIKKREAISLGVLFACVILWAIEDRTGFDSHVIAVAGLTFLLMTGTLSVADFRESESWTTLLSSGTILTLGTVLTSVGINDYVAKLISPIIVSLSSNTFIFMAALVILIYLMHLVLASSYAGVALLLSIFLPLRASLNVDMWLLGFVMLTASGSWLMMYQNSLAVFGFATFGGAKEMRYSQLSKGCLWYWGVNVVAVLLCVPYWRLLGLIR